MNMKTGIDIIETWSGFPHPQATQFCKRNHVNLYNSCSSLKLSSVSYTQHESIYPETSLDLHADTL